nr:uncharacterized protein LOC133570191 isoform X3 [Nerophis lumbriciformis]
MCERTIVEYEEELSRTKEGKERQRQLLDAVFKKHQVVLHRTDVSEEHLLPEQQGWRFRMDKEEPQPSHIEEEEVPQTQHIKKEEEYPLTLYFKDEMEAQETPHNKKENYPLTSHFKEEEEEPLSPHIKEEEEKHSISQAGEHLE